MARKVVVLAAEDWNVLFETLGRGPMPQDVQGQMKVWHLYETIQGAIRGATEDPFGVPLTGDQRQRLILMMDTPPIPWRIDAFPRVRRIKEGLGWRAPEFVDEEEDEEGAE